MWNRIVLGACGVVACGVLAAESVAQSPCGVRSTYRIITNMSGATGPGELIVNLPWTVAGPVVGSGAITTTNPTGQTSSMSAVATADYGPLSLLASGSASSGSGNGVFFRLDEYFGAAPKAEFSDRLVVVSGTLPAGTPVSLVFTLSLEGSAALNDTAPYSVYSANLRVDSAGQPGIVLSTGLGTQTATFPTFVGRTVNITGGLFATFHANGLLGGAPLTASLSCDLRSRVSLAVQTAGVGITSCSGSTYAAPPVCGTSDFNGDGDFGTDQDIEAFFACLAGSCCATCFSGGSDFNGDGDFGTDQDIESFFRVLGGGAC